MYLKGRILERGGETKRNLLPASLLPKRPQQPGLGQNESGAKNFCVFHMGAGAQTSSVAFPDTLAGRGLRRSGVTGI